MSRNLGILIGIGSGILLGSIIGGLIYIHHKNSMSIKSILFIGDSNTAANFSYADQLKKQFPNLRLKKIALNGSNTTWMKQQLVNELNSNKYDAVSILGGSNDIYGGMKLTDTESNLFDMYTLARGKGSKVVAITPPNKNFYVNKTAEKQQMLSDLINYIRRNPYKDYFVDFHGMTNNKSLFTSADGYLHPQALAHSKLAQVVQKDLNLQNV